MTIIGALSVTALRQSLLALAEMGVIPGIGRVLEDSAAKVGGQLRDAVLGEIPAFAESGNPDVLPALEQHAACHIQEIWRLFSGGEVGDFGFVATHAQLRAEQRFPLELSLHAYRCGHRVLSQWLRGCVAAAAPEALDSAVSAVADFAIEYTDTISSRATAAYVEHTRRLAEAEGDRRKELLHLLLAGYDEADGRVAGLLRRSGYLDQRQAYAVVTALPVNAAEMENAPRAQRLVSALADAFGGTPFRVLAGQHEGLALAILSDRRRQSGWTAAQSPVSRRIVPLLQLLGPSVLIGVSADHPSTAFIPKAFQEARDALFLASTAKRVVHFAELSLRERILQRAMDDIQPVPPPWAAHFAAANEKANGALVQTLHALAETNLNVQAAARRLGKHPNTIYARVERIIQITGHDPQNYYALTELLLASACWQMRSR